MNNRKSFALAGSALLQFHVVSAFAQSAPTPLDQVVVTATRTEQKVADTILDTTVITQQDIRDSQAVDLPSLLQREAGFELVQSGGIGSTSSIFLRGTNSTHTLVLIDGVRASSATTSTTAIDQIMLDEVERVEIVRGNVSSVYGADAIGGVIQIFTKRGHGAPALSALAGMGDRGTYRVNGSYGGQVNNTNFNFTVSDYGTRGFSAINNVVVPTADPDRDGYRNTSLSGNIVQRFGPSTHIGFSGYISEGHLDYDDAFAFSTTDKQTSKTHVGYFSLFGDYQVNTIWSYKLTLATGTDYSANYLNGAPNGTFRTTTNQAIWQNDIVVAPGQKVIAGLEGRHQEVASDTGYVKSGRDVGSGFVGYTGEFGPHSVQGNVRTEHYSDFGSATTYLAGYGYKITDAWRVTAAASSAFRAPNFNELYYPGFGNPDLQPERATSGEVGLQYGSGAQLAKLVVFRTRIHDLIGGFPIANINQAEITGAELSYHGQIYGADVFGSVTAQDPVDQSGGNQQLLRRARHFAALSVQKSFGAWRLGGEMRASGVRYDDNQTAFPTVRDTLAGYGVVNLTARYRINKELSLQARAENVFNRHYELADGYNTQPAGFFLGLSYQPGP
jgi:vitamin B12 transporter